MAAKRIPRKTAARLPVSIAIGTAVGMIGALSGAAVLTTMILNGKIGESSMRYGCLAVLAVSAILGSLIAALTANERKFIAATATGASMFAVLISCTALFFGGQYSGIAVTLLLTVGIGLCVGMISSKKKGRSFKRVKKYRFV